MGKVTSKLQLTLPKRIADQYGIKPGTNVEFEPAHDVIRLRPVTSRPPSEARDLAWKLRLFDDSRKRQRARNRLYAQRGGKAVKDRGWTRAELYGDRGVPR